MKTQFLTAAFIVAGLALSAQTSEKKQATVRIKKVENVNGVEKVTDTTFTTDHPEDFKWQDKDGHVQLNEIKGEDGKVMKIVTVDHIGTEMKGMDDKEMNAAIEKAMKEAGVDMNTKDGKRVIVINNSDSEKGNGAKAEKTYTKIVMINLDITDATPEDISRLKNQLGGADNKVEMENMKLYPNPNDGKFNLNFNLKNRGDAEVTVYDMQGKQVYSEKLSNFAGEYNKPIDISSNAKGIYFVKIQQGNHTQVKKISLD